MPGHRDHPGMPGASRIPGQSPELLCAAPSTRMGLPGFWTVGVSCFAKPTEPCTLDKGSCFVLLHQRPGDFSDQTLVHLDSCSSPSPRLCPPSRHNPSCLCNEGSRKTQKEEAQSTSRLGTKNTSMGYRARTQTPQGQNLLCPGLGPKWVFIGLLLIPIL